MQPQVAKLELKVQIAFAYNKRKTGKCLCARDGPRVSSH